MSNNVDYCEILLQTIDILNSSKTTPLGAAELSSTSLEQPTMVVNPFASILEREVLQLASQEIELEGNTEQSSQEIWRLQEPDRAYDRLVISFKSKVSEMPTDEFAHYGIELTLMAMNMDTTVVFDSSEFFGNPWSTSLAMLQKQSFDLSSLIGLQAIKVKIYNYSSSIITIQGLHLGIGYALENYNVDGTPLTLFVESDTELKYYTTARKLLDGEKTKNIEIKARWIYGEGIEKRAITDLSSLPDGMSLRWYKHTPQNAQGDQFSGSYWWEIPNNTGFSLNLTAESNYYQLEDQNTQFKAVLVAQGLGGGLPQVYTSNIITVVNVQAKSDDLVFDHLLELEDKTNGLYTFYDFDDNIDPRYFAELNQIRSVFFKYSTRYSDIISHIKKIVWKIPNGLLEFVDAPSNVYSDNGYNYYETNNAITETNLEMKYKLSSTRSRGATKSKIVCIIYDDQDQTYSAEKEIALLMASNTDNPTVIRLLDDGNNIVQAIRDINKTYYLSAKIYNDQGEELTPKSIDVAEIKNAGTVKVTQLESKSNFSVKVDNAASINILKITFTLVKENNGKTLQVVEYYPIAITNADWVYAGPTEIVYESNGNNPSFSPAAAAIQNISDVNWETQKDISQTVAPVIDADTGIITPKVAYDPEMFGHYAIKATQGGNYWLQPIIIYMKPFYSRIINDWDGRLSINNDNNYIMASAYVAGSKDKDNKFTGAILGELATITEDKKDIRENGLFGYNGGQQTFGLKSDGTAFFGASGKGRININGDGGIIESGNFDINAKTGTQINLADGSFNFGGGRFKYDGGEKITLNNVAISWDSTNAPLIEDVEGLQDYLDQVGDLQTQLDGRAQTWYQDTDPRTSEGWVDSEHVKDLWHYTGQTQVVNGVPRTKDSEWILEQVNGGYKWTEIQISDEVFDLINGKASLFVSKPSNYRNKDMWILDVENADGNNNTYPQFKQGTLLVSSATNPNYAVSDWSEKVRYTDDTTADDALSKAKTGIEEAAKALTTATNAQTTATNAQTTATNAQTAAGEAKTAAGEAKTAAGTAETNAKKHADDLAKKLTTAYKQYADSAVKTLDDSVSTYLGLNGPSVMTDEYIISPYLGGGYLNITGKDNKMRVIIDPNNLTKNGYVFQIHDGNKEKVIVGIDKGGNAEFNGKVTAISGYIGTEKEGFAIADQAIRNEYNVSQIAAENNGNLSKLYMTSYNKLNQNSSLWDYYINDVEGNPINRDYVYIGTDGIGTYKINSTTGGTITNASQTYMTAGKLFSNSADITGKITATSGEFLNAAFNTGTIGGIQVVPQAICDNSAGVGRATWGISSSSTYSGYDSILLSSGALSLSGTSPITFFSGASSGLDVTAANNTNGIEFYVTKSGLINAKNILCNDGIIALKTRAYDAYLNAGQFVIRNNGSDISARAGDKLTLSAYQLVWYGSAAGGNARIDFNPNTGIAKLYGTWETSASEATTSWRGAKHDIETLEDKYSVLFDNLHPVRFKYNDGESDRYHTGFILDELKDAMDKASVDSSEFAAYCVNDEQTGEGGIRYSEIIALNTLEIQKLKARVAELEDKIFLLLNKDQQ